jgi:hypothetical protein
VNPLRVLLTPEAAGLPAGERVARRLAGQGGRVFALGQAGVRTLRRELSPAEIHYLRRALLGLAPGEDLRPRPDNESVVGLVCAGRAAPGAGRQLGAAAEAGAGGESDAAAGEPGLALHAVSDHVNLAWRSPLRGPNDDSLGPRFPALTGLYRPDAVRARLDLAAPGEVVACPADDRDLRPFELEVVERHGFRLLSTELAPVALLAAHLGYRVAAAVLERKDA